MLYVLKLQGYKKIFTYFFTIIPLKNPFVTHPPRLSQQTLESQKIKLLLKMDHTLFIFKLKLNSK